MPCLDSRRTLWLVKKRLGGALLETFLNDKGHFNNVVVRIYSWYNNLSVNKNCKHCTCYLLRCTEVAIKGEYHSYLLLY